MFRTEPVWDWFRGFHLTTPVAARHSTLNYKRSRFRYLRCLLLEWFRGLGYPVKDLLTRSGSKPVVGTPGQWWEGPGPLLRAAFHQVGFDVT